MIHYEKIPNRIKMGGQELAVKRVERCSDNSVGEMCLAAGYIEIADKFNKDNIQSESSKVNTFYHETVHAVLDMMGRFDLSKDEVFVCSFSGFLADAMDKAYFLEEKADIEEAISSLAKVTLAK